MAEAALAGPGHELPHRAALETQFGVPLDDVIAHTGPAAQAANRSLGAAAFAIGHRVAFADASPTRETVAHEVAHVLQQTRGGGARSETEDEAEAGAAERGASLAYAAQGRAGGTALRLQERPILSPAAANSAILFNRGRRLPASAWTRISAVVGIGTTTIDDAMVQAIARWQQGQGLDADGKVNDVVLQWMSSQPGGAGLEAAIRSEPIAYMGINPTSRDTELRTLRGTGTEVNGATGRSAQGTALVGGQVVQLSTPEGLDAYVAQFDRLDASKRAEVRAFLEEGNSDARDELAQFVQLFYEAEIGRRLIRRVVLSGHSAGESIGGEGNNDTSVDFSHLRGLATLFPRGVGQVEDLMLSACNTGQTGKLDQYKAIFPNLRSIWAYVGFSPLGSSAGVGANRHMLAWERATRGPVHHNDINAARGRIATGGGKNDPNVAIQTIDGAGVSRYETSSPEAGYDYQTLRNLVDNTRDAYDTAYKDGDIGPTALSLLYTRLQNLTGNYQGDLGDDYEGYLLMTKHVLYLRHWSSITSHFWKAHSKTITAAYQGHGAVPNYLTGSRSQVLSAIEAFPGDRNGDAYKLLTELLRDLDPEQIPDQWY